MKVSCTTLRQTGTSGSEAVEVAIAGGTRSNRRFSTRSGGGRRRRDKRREERQRQDGKKYRIGADGKSTVLVMMLDVVMLVVEREGEGVTSRSLRYSSRGSAASAPALVASPDTTSVAAISGLTKLEKHEYKGRRKFTSTRC